MRTTILYDDDVAMQVIMDNISYDLLFKHEEHLQIIDLEFEFMYMVGLIPKEGEEPPICTYPLALDMDAMKDYIVTNAAKKDIYLSYEDLDEILEAELIIRNGRLVGR